MSIETHKDAAIDAILRQQIAADAPSPDFADRVVDAAIRQSGDRSSKARWALAIAAAVALGAGGALWLSGADQGHDAKARAAMASARPPAPKPAGVATSLALASPVDWVEPLLALPSTTPSSASMPSNAQSTADWRTRAWQPTAPTQSYVRQPSAVLVRTERPPKMALKRGDRLTRRAPDDEAAPMPAKSGSDASGTTSPKSIRPGSVLEQVAKAMCAVVQAAGGPPASLASCAKMVELRPRRLPALQLPARKRTAPLTNKEYDAGMSKAHALFAEGDDVGAIRALEMLQRGRPAAKAPKQMLCSLYREVGRSAEALRACRWWAERETNRIYRDRAQSKAAELEAELRADTP